MQNHQALDKKYIWHPFTQMKDWLQSENIIIELGEGFYLTDTKGKRYIDGVSSLWCNVHGHRKKELDDAIRAQLDKVAHTTFLGLSNVPATELAAQLIAIAPAGLSKVFYSDSGAEAVEVALKMGYQYWQQKSGNYKNKNKYLHLTHSYHGDTLGSVSVGGIELFHKVYKPFIFETFETPAPYCYRCPFDKECNDCSMECLTALQNMVRAHADELIGIVMEPRMLGAAGMLKQPDGFLKGVREITRECNVLLICDEVATGFGRTGDMFAVDSEGITPDLMAVGKGITGGYLPLSATLVTDEIFNAFLGECEECKTFFHGHTYTGNPLAAAVAVANLRLFQTEQIIGHSQKIIPQLTAWLNDFIKLKHVGDVRQAGLMVGIELVKDKKTKEPYAAHEQMGHRVIMKAREKGAIIRPLGNVVVLMPPPAIDAALLKELVDITYASIKECTA